MLQFSRLLSTTTLALVTLSLLPNTGNAQITHATTEIEGLTCPFCSFGAAKRLKKVDGVREVNVETTDGWAALSAENGQSIDVRKIPDAVKSAGFIPGLIRIVAIGTVHNRDGQMFLKIDEHLHLLSLTEVQAITQDQLRELADNGAVVEMTGVWQPGSNNVAQIVPETIKSL